MLDLTKILIPSEDAFTDEEKLIINLVLEYEFDRNSVIKEISTNFRINTAAAEGKFLMLQKSILSKVSYAEQITYSDFVIIVNEIDKVLGC